ncbi:type II secretion system ATPase GspE [soil metagenome]
MRAASEMPEDGHLETLSAPPDVAAHASPVPSAWPEAAPETIAPSPRFLAAIPHEVARRHLVFGLRERGGVVTVACRPGTDALALANLARWLERAVETESCEAEPLARLIDAAYAEAAWGGRRGAPDDGAPARDGSAPIIALTRDDFEGADLDAELARAALDADADLLHTGQKAPLVRLVDSILFDAIGQGASDIHVQPLAHVVLIRYRVDGVLATARCVPARLAAALVTRIKVMARMDVAERRAPQDGRATVVIGGGAEKRTGTWDERPRSTPKSIDLRISSLPTSFGERAVIRLLYADQTRARASIAGLAMPAPLEAAFLERCGRSSGIVLVTGPTGSGKTTTLYATLRWIITRSAAADVNILTIEDPIEYDLSADDGADEQDGAEARSQSDSGRASRGAGVPISQTQVDPKKGLLFATGLRHILRQDPDVIMVGEIRDAETARIAIQASLTGHMVFSTLHTGDAPSAVSRLIDLGVEPFLICSTLSAVLAQRLARLLHGECSGGGCAACLGTGFRGRRGLFELLLLDDELRGVIARRGSSTELRAAAVHRGMTPLAAAGEALVHAGLTTHEEVRRVTLGVE